VGNWRDNEAMALLPLADESALWEATRGGNTCARERLIEAYLPYARILAAKLFTGRIDHDQDFDEYLQFATVGLIEAVDRYDPARSTQFKTFASLRINGAVLNGLAHLSEKREQLSARSRLLVDRRDSGKAALAEEKDVFQQLADIAIGLAVGRLLDETDIDQPDVAAIVPQNHYAGLELRQLQQKIRSLVDGLPHQERMVIKYHYLNHVPFNLIAETMRVTRGRISQIHRQALELLREKIKAVKSCDLAW
jgi:RNA polymerase sigma factor for flagellar operon FliA